MRKQVFWIAALLLLAPASAWAGAQEDVAKAAQEWADAFNARDPDRLLALYDVDAVFWPSASPVMRDSPAAIREYFSDLPGRPLSRVTAGEQRIRLYGDVAVNGGFHTFSDVRDGRAVTAPTRFSFVYRQRAGRWLIVDHHSSAVPSAGK
jgi:uncharacterized protein (TIGR02246 family)